jgi:hypothetical protein
MLNSPSTPHNLWEEPVEKVELARHWIDRALEHYEKNDWQHFLMAVNLVKECLQDF